MRNYSSKFISLLILFLIAGCTTPTKEPPFSLSVKGVPIEDLKGIVGDVYISGGWKLENESDSSMSFIISSDKWYNLFLGPGSDPDVYFREKINFFKVGDTFKIYRFLQVVVDPNTNWGYETLLKDSNIIEPKSRQVIQIENLIREVFPNAVVTY